MCEIQQCTKEGQQTKKTMEDQLYTAGMLFLPVLLVAGVFLHFSPVDLTDIVPGCLLYRLTGLYCPGCGATRALSAFLHGHPIRSFLYHPVVDYVAALYLWFLLSQTIERISHGRIAIGMKYRDRYLWIVLAVLILHCLIRNVLKMTMQITSPL